VVEADDGRLLGFSHHRVFERPMARSTGMWLDDLFVDESARGRGIAALLLDEVRRRAGERGCSVVRWTTGPDNSSARRLYDKVGSVRTLMDYEATPLR
jgi:Acetyltransferase (GNAT) family.